MNTTFNIFFLFFFYFFIIFSITGFGLLFSSLILKKNTDSNIGYSGIFGLFFVSIYSYISSNFYAHSLIHNLFFNFLGLFLFIFFFLKIKKNIIISFLY